MLTFTKWDSIKVHISSIPKKKLWASIGVTCFIILILVVVGAKTLGAVRDKKIAREKQKQENISREPSVQMSTGSTLVEENVSISGLAVTETSSGTSSASIAKPKSSTTNSGGATSPSTTSSSPTNDQGVTNVTSPNSPDSSSSSANGTASSSTDTSSAIASCGSSYSLFDHAPTDMSDFANIAPLGNLNPSGHVFPTDHIYFYHSSNTTSTVYAPGNITVTRISASENQTAGTTDYSIYFKPCNELEAYYLHISTMSQKLLSAFVAPFSWDSTYSTGGSTYRNYGRNIQISLTSGEILGTFTGQYAFDMGAYDSRVTLNFINADARPNSIHTVCPLDYYSDSLKANLYSYLGSSAYNKRTIPPICGTIDQDVAGTAQGIWLLAGTTKVNSEDTHLALVHGNTDPTTAAFSVGTSVGASGLLTGVYTFTPSDGAYNKDFSAVTADSGAQCYRATAGATSTILIQLATPTTLKIEKLDGDCSAPRSFTSSATEFQR